LVSDAKQSRVAFGWFISAMNTVMAPMVKAGDVRASVSSITPGSKRQASTSGRRTMKAAPIWPISPVI
jgi:hypothetical protein